MQPLRHLLVKINNVEVSFSAIHTVRTFIWSCIFHEFKDTFEEKYLKGVFQNHFALFPCLFTLGLYIGRSINGLVFFFAGLAEVHVTVLSVLNRRRQGFPATCPIGHCCVCSPLLFASEILCDSPTFNKQRMNKVSPSRWTCYLETQSARWRHVEWSLGFVYGLLLGNCGQQTDRKILRSSRDPRATKL